MQSNCILIHTSIRHFISGIEAYTEQQNHSYDRKYRKRYRQKTQKKTQKKQK